MNKSIPFMLSLLLFVLPIPSYAYIGPGMGGGVIAIVFGFFAATFLALWAILYYPIKRALKNRRGKKMASKKLNDET